MALTKSNKTMLVGDEEGLIKYLDTHYKQTNVILISLIHSKEIKCSDTKADAIKEISYNY